MSDHPSRELLEEFLRGSLPVAEVRAVVAHLLQGCESCREAMAPIARLLFETGGSGGEEGAETSAYDEVISSVRERLRGRREGLARERRDARKRLGVLLFHPSAAAAAESAAAGPATWALCEALLEHSTALGHDDPRGMLRLAQVAAMVADQLDVKHYGVAPLADLQAQAWSELANAYRVNDDLDTAERALDKAVRLRDRGTGDPLLLARISDLAATLRSAQRRFDEAFRLLDVAHALYLESGDRHGAGRTLLKRGIYAGHANRPAEAVELLSRGLGMIDRERDPKLVFSTLHNLAHFLVELGRVAQVRALLVALRPLYTSYAGRIDRLKILALEGKVALASDELEVAERSFVEEREGLIEAGLPYMAALVGLDLAEVWLRMGRAAEVRVMVEELLAAFRSLSVEREATATLLLLREAIGRSREALDLLRVLAASVRRLDRLPGLPLEERA